MISKHEIIFYFFISLGKITFMQGIGRHLAVLMKEKEETMGRSAESWLYAEATTRECLNKAGTFRYSTSIRDHV